VLSDDGNGVELVLLGLLGGDLLHQGLEVRLVHGGGDPLVLGEELVLVTALNSTSDAVDALIRLNVGETLKGLLGNFVLLLEEIIVSISTN